MATMGRTGRGRARRTVSAEAAAAADEPTFDIAAKEMELTEAFAREFEFRGAESDLASPGSEVRAARAAPSFEQLKEEYAELWAELAIRRERLAEADRIVQRIIANKDRYRTVEASTAVPWYVIAVIHSLEGSLNFRTHLHNGDPLSARTVHVPAGRPRTGTPPFSWEESAMDALAYDGIMGNTDWSIERIAYILEGFNGWGYRRFHPEVKSPYLWSFSNHYTSGKYVADGRWSPTAVSDQCGAMVLLRRLDDQGAIRAQRSRDEPSGHALSHEQLPGDAAPSTSRMDQRGNYDLSRLDTPFSASPSTYDPGFRRASGFQLDHDGCEAELDDLRGAPIAFTAAPDMPKSVPVGNPVPFGQSRVSPAARHWPVISNNASRLVVSYETVGGQDRGGRGRKFLALRSNGTRFHVGVDLFANPNDDVVACEDGQIVAFYAFYPASSGEMTYALLVEHLDFVVNYGEVKGNAPDVFGWRVGDRVAAGQRIARVSSTSMTHFETYTRSTRQNRRWHPGEPRPPALLNPTLYLLELTSG